MITLNLRAQNILKYMLLSTIATTLKIKCHQTIEKTDFRMWKTLFSLILVERDASKSCDFVTIFSQYCINITAKKSYKIETRYGWRQLGPIHFMDRHYVF